MIKFCVIPNVASQGVRLVYRRHEYSFDAEPKPEGCKTCISVNEVGLEYGDERRILCVTGYCPYQGWRETLLSPPAYSLAGLVVVAPQDFVAGGATGLNDLKSRWPVYVNPEGWVCIGDPADHGEQATEFAPNSVAVLRGGCLVALWLHPTMLGDD
jgi:hypothetical protein